MSRLVMKFGGTSVRDLERIRNAAGRVKREVDAGNEVAVVVSAMAGKTDELVGWVRDAANGPGSATPFPDGCEYDAVVASGEQVTAGLMALTLQSMGVRARSWLGWQLPVRSTDAHGRARIVEIETGLLEQGFSDGCHAVVSGFQGLGPDQRITTLGRGGSDTSAVALAAALKAERCDIYTDVEGIYTTDPRIVRRARKLDRIAYEEMLELASLGAKVLQTRSVELAMRYKVRLQVLSSLEDKPGTLVCDEEEIVEENAVSGIAYSRDEAKITLIRVPDRPGVAAQVFGPLADAGINVDMIVQNISTDGMTDLTFSVAESELARARQALENAFEPVGYQALDIDDDVCKVSVVGIGMRSHAGIAQKMFAALAREGVNIKVISTSEIKVSVLIGRRYLELAVQALHSAFDLDAA
ncbi:MAG TPA: aspartate kinase [Thermohalobaculum sp.]|nr:aspartate kinase [Thermohalobaculum sp.]